MLAVKFHRYQKAYIVVRTDNKATDFAGLEGQTLSIPAASVGFPELFVNARPWPKVRNWKLIFPRSPGLKNRKTPSTTSSTASCQATIVDQAVLETYKRRSRDGLLA